MSTKNFSSLLFSLVLLAVFSSCKKDNGGEETTSEQKLLDNANGFEFVGAFEEVDAPIYYHNPNEFIMEEYQDQVRIMVMTESTIANPPDRKKWYVLNYQNGKLIQTIRTDDGFGPDWGNFMDFAFDHEQLTLQSWHTTEKYFYQINQLGQETSYFITGGTSLTTKLIKNHLLRFISGISVWPYSVVSQQDEPQYLLTSELSAMAVLNYFYDKTYETEGSNSIYTGYFYPSYDGNWIGVARGNQSLDTLMISHEVPQNYFTGLCQTYVERVGNKINLAFIKNKMSPNTDQDISFYELTIGENVLHPILVDRALPPNGNYVIRGFRNGKLYVFPTANATDQQPYTLAMDGTETRFSIPTPTSTAGLLRIRFTNGYMFVVLTDGVKRLEFYKKAL